MSRWRAPRCSASACGRCAPSRTCRWRGWRGDSCVRPHEADEDLFERALPRLQILELDPELGELAEQRRDAGTLVLGVEREDELLALARQLERVAGERLR